MKHLYPFMRRMLVVLLIYGCLTNYPNLFADPRADRYVFSGERLCLLQNHFRSDTVPKKNAEEDFILKGDTLQRLSSRFIFTEGPAVDKHGNIFFTDQPNDKIWKYSTSGKFTVFLDKTGRSNGMYFSRNGNLLTCADENNELWSISPDGKKTVLLKDFQGHRFNGPNDLWEDSQGGIYFTDPYYQRPYWNRKKSELDGEKVYYLPKGYKQAHVVVDDLLQPNGIVGTPDGKTLYVADIRGNKTYKYSIAKKGKLENKQLFVEQGSDGMTLDNKGNVYLTGNGVTVYSKSGARIMHIDVPSKWTANLCFGGKYRNTLFITASESVYILPMRVHGVE